MRLLPILLLCLTAVSCADTYKPGLNLMVKDIVYGYMIETYVPDIMQMFENIKPEDAKYYKDEYTVQVYDTKAEFAPLTADQIQLEFVEADNTVFFNFTNVEMYFNAKTFVQGPDSKGDGTTEIQAVIDELSFRVKPELKDHEGLNMLGFELSAMDLIITDDDIKIESFKPELPDELEFHFYLEIMKSITDTYEDFVPIADLFIEKVFEKHRDRVPGSIPLPETPLNVSLLFSDLLQLKDDRLEVPFDGSIFVADEGYYPHGDDVADMPTYNEDNPNNVQAFLNQHMLKTFIDSVIQKEMVFMVKEEYLEPLHLPHNALTVKYFCRLFPELMSVYKDLSLPVTIGVTVDEEMGSSLSFDEGVVKGELSPSINLYVKDELAITISVMTILEAQLNFEMKDGDVYMTGSLTKLDLGDFVFTAGTVTDAEITELIDLFKPKINQLTIDTLNILLSTGATVPAVAFLKDLFELEIPEIDMSLHANYIEASFALSLSERMSLIEQFLKRSA